MQQMKCRDAFAAERGYILRDGGVFRGIATFDRCESEKMEYFIYTELMI